MGVLFGWARGCELTIQRHHLTEYYTELSTESVCCDHSSGLGIAKFLDIVQSVIRRQTMTKIQKEYTKCNVPSSEPLELMIIDLRLITSRRLLSSWATVSFSWRTLFLGVLQCERKKHHKGYWSLWLYLHFVLWSLSPVDIFSKTLSIQFGDGDDLSIIRDAFKF